MLILKRRAGESVLIGGEVEIEVLETGPWGVKIGIRAPKAISILRKELQVTRDANCAAARDTWNQALAILNDLHLPDADNVRARLASLTVPPDAPDLP